RSRSIESSVSLSSAMLPCASLVAKRMARGSTRLGDSFFNKPKNGCYPQMLGPCASRLFINSRAGDSRAAIAGPGDLQFGLCEEVVRVLVRLERSGLRALRPLRVLGCETGGRWRESH